MHAVLTVLRYNLSAFKGFGDDAHNVLVGLYILSVNTILCRR